MSALPLMDYYPHGTPAGSFGVGSLGAGPWPAAREASRARDAEVLFRSRSKEALGWEVSGGSCTLDLTLSASIFFFYFLNRQTGTQVDTQIHRQTGRQADTQVHRQTGTQADTQIHRQIDRKTHKYTDRLVDR